MDDKGGGGQKEKGRLCKSKRERPPVINIHHLALYDIRSVLFTGFELCVYSSPQPIHAYE